MDLITSWPLLGRYGIGLWTPIGSFGDPSKLVLHNWIGGPSMGFQMLSVVETLYYIASQQDKSIIF
jgi:hypothetical protein